MSEIETPQEFEAFMSGVEADSESILDRFGATLEELTERHGPDSIVVRSMRSALQRAARLWLLDELAQMFSPENDQDIAGTDLVDKLAEFFDNEREIFGD